LTVYYIVFTLDSTEVCNFRILAQLARLRLTLCCVQGKDVI